MIVLLSESLGVFLTGICQISAHPVNTWRRQAMELLFNAYIHFYK